MMDPALAVLLDRAALNPLGRGGSRCEKGYNCDGGGGDGELTHVNLSLMSVGTGAAINQRYSVYANFIFAASKLMQRRPRSNHVFLTMPRFEDKIA
jgi:hypothetical protein